MTYKEITKKDVDTLTLKEQKIRIDTETLYYRDRVEQLREQGIEDYKIGAYLHDLYHEYVIFDDVELANAYGISNDDWEKALDYYWNDMFEENPLMD